MKDSVTLEVNGTTHRIHVHPDEPLALALRNRLGLTGVKVGCSLEQCGACAVLVDGASTLTCVRPAADFDGRRIETVEGLGTPGVPGTGPAGAARRGRRAVRVLHARTGGSRSPRCCARTRIRTAVRCPGRARAPPVPVRRPSARAAGGAEARRGAVSMSTQPESRRQSRASRTGSPSVRTTSSRSAPARSRSASGSRPRWRWWRPASWGCPSSASQWCLRAPACRPTKAIPPAATRWSSRAARCVSPRPPPAAS